jgi:ABC-2 type transport system permease protein
MTAVTVRRTLLETRLLAGRSLRHIPRIPEKLADVTIQPIVFVLLFAYVFGSAISVPGGGSYREYLIAGMFAQGMFGPVMGIAVGMAEDVRTGIVDRLRALPISRFAVLAGRAVSELAQVVLGLAVFSACGLVVGWQPHGTVLETAAAYALLVLWAFAGVWIGTFLGMVVRSAETAQTVGFTVFFPMLFLSAIFVPIGGLRRCARSPSTTR